MIDKATFEKWQEWSRRDDACNLFITSDIRQMLGDISRLSSGLDYARANLRKLAVHRTVEETHAGPVWSGGMECRVCRGAWKKDATEIHAETCPLAAVVG